MDWLRKTPIVSLLFAVAIAAVPLLLAHDPVSAGAVFDKAREQAREYLTRNPRLELDNLGELVLDREWVTGMRTEQASAEGQLDVRLPPRLLARSQARLDELITEAYQARLDADAAWRLGVLDRRSPAENYFAHVFVHDTLPGAALCVVVLLFAGTLLERTWGSPIFGAFVVGSILAVAQAYRFLDASSGVPWYGGAGLAGALVGAYFIRGLGGHFPVPGWVLLPVWVGVECFVVRGFWIDDFGTVPWATLCAAVGVGALVAGVLRGLNIEAALDERANKRKAMGPNPIVARVARLRSDGDPYQAFDLIQAAWREDPKDADICEAFFSIAVEVGQPEVAATAILPSLRWALKAGDVPRALDYWLPLASKECAVELEPTVLVRLGEALLDVSRPEEALFSLRAALAAGASASHAARIVRIARDLDETLARKAATIALQDHSLDPKIRAELAQIAALREVDETGQESTLPPTPVAVQPTKSQLDRRVQAEHQAVETTMFPLDLDSDVESFRLDDDDDLETDLDGMHDANDPNAETVVEASLYAVALTEDNLAEEVGDRTVVDFGVPIDSDIDSGDVLSHWNDPTALDTIALSAVTESSGTSHLEETFLDVADLETPGAGFDFGLRAGALDLVDPRDDETDSDFTPMIESTDEMTSPMASSRRVGSISDADASTILFDLPARSADPKLQRPLPVASPSPRQEPSPSRDEFAFGGVDGEATSLMQLRPLKARNAVPLDAGEDWLEIDADDRGKSKLPYARIQAISIVAVSGLGPRPVLVLDLVLNWTAGRQEPMKLVRLRSDRFDPFDYADGANPLAALTAWVNELERESSATCLPSRDVLNGSFARYASLAEYERQVLMALSAAD